MPIEEEVLVALKNEQAWTREGPPSPAGIHQLVTSTLNSWDELHDLGLSPTRALAVVLPGRLLFGEDLAALRDWNGLSQKILRT